MREYLLQWGITNQCERSCSHCYLSNSERNPYKDLSTSDCLRIIDDFSSFVDRFNLKGRIAFTGGDPLKRKDLPILLAHSKSKNLLNHILGNPDLLSEDNLQMLVDNGVSRYQLSFDGLKSLHDKYRGQGCFQMSYDAIKKLKSHNIEVVVMNTVTRENAHDLPELAKIVIQAGASRFDFSRLVPIGNGKDMKDLVFSPQEYRAFLDMMHNAYKRMINDGIPKTALGTKDPLWSLLLHEKGELSFPEKDGLIYQGCSIGKSGICLDADGSLYGCRRMPESSANIKDTTFIEFFFKDKLMNSYRDFDKIEGCNDCELISVCRGCRAVAWAQGSYYGRDPQCWLEKNSKGENK